MNKKQRKEIERIFDRLSEISEELECIKAAEEEKLYNLPENLQNSEKADQFTDAIDTLGEAMDSITEACEKLEEIFNAE